jgi:hypothetical protein
VIPIGGVWIALYAKVAFLDAMPSTRLMMAAKPAPTHP